MLMTQIPRVVLSAHRGHVGILDSVQEEIRTLEGKKTELKVILKETIVLEVKKECIKRGKQKD